MSDLLPCPFCGGTEIKLRDNGIGDTFAQCTGCHARTSDRNSEVDSVAIERWNTRTPADNTVRVPADLLSEVIHVMASNNFRGDLIELLKAAQEGE